MVKLGARSKIKPPTALHFPTTMPAAPLVPISDTHVGDLSISGLATTTGASRDGLRFYGTRGLIRAQCRSNDYRAYPPEIMELVQYVRMAQQLGFILAEIKESMSHMWQQPDTDAVVTALLRNKLAMVDTHIASLQVTRSTLATRVGMACPLAPTRGGHHVLSCNCRRLALQDGIFTFLPNLTAR